MAPEAVKLLGSWASPYVIRVRVALKIKGVSYEFLEEDMGSKSDLLLKSNPVYKKIPVLLHNDKPICESLIIVQYVDDVWAGSSILPADPYDRAQARFWATYVEDKWFPSMRGIAFAQSEEAKREAIKQVEEGLAVLEGAFHSCSKGKKFFGGDTIGLVDIALGSNIGWVRVTEELNAFKLLDEAKLPGLAKWEHDFCEDDAVKEIMPSTEKLSEFAKMVFANMKK
ncbi:hypothetical protein DM860_011286 [Cuscuta australis]|uniref:glutathione transferase n=1 Tax=Cuscuta australis TaxID=267555 RepID=A0A328DSD5_9ASTE|nr:hypothetical protein DM860_011286 [Cuscuta australis]